MVSISISILPVYSELHPTEAIGSMPLLKHQVETLQAFRNSDIDVIFNTAMTGDGKSLAAYLPAFQDHKHVGMSNVSVSVCRTMIRCLARRLASLCVSMIRWSVWRKYAN